MHCSGQTTFDERVRVRSREVVLVTYSPERQALVTSRPLGTWRAEARLPDPLTVRQEHNLAEHPAFAQHLVRAACLFKW